MVAWIVLLPLLVLAPITLASFALFASERYRATLLALAVAAVPLTTLFWVNIATLPELFSEGASNALRAEDLSGKLTRLMLWGLAPAGLAWWILWRAPAPCACPRLSLRPMARAARGAAATLAVVAFVGLGLGVLPGPFQATASSGLGLWTNVTPWLLIGLSLTAAVAEELLFRGVLYVALVPVMGFVAAGFLQGALFGLVHAAYGDPLYVLAAAAFGVLQAYVSVRWGLLVAIMVHAQANLVILGWASRTTFEINGAIALALVSLNILLLVPASLACLFSPRASCPLTPGGDGLAQRADPRAPA